MRDQNRRDIINERAQGDIQARQKSPSKRFRQLPDKRLQAMGVAQAADLWRRTDHLVGEGGEAMWRITSALTSLVGGTGLQHAFATYPAQFTLLSRSAVGEPLILGGTPWVLTMTGPGRSEAQISDHGDGAYTIRYVCSNSGRYRLSVRLGEQHLTGSPFEISVRPMPTSSALGFAVIEASLGVAASARHNVRGLWHRWIAYLPLAQLVSTRTFTLLMVGQEHFERNALADALHTLSVASVRDAAANSFFRSRRIAVLSKRLALSLAFWRRITYTRVRRLPPERPPSLPLLSHPAAAASPLLLLRRCSHSLLLSLLAHTLRDRALAPRALAARARAARAHAAHAHAAYTTLTGLCTSYLADVCRWVPN